MEEVAGALADDFYRPALTEAVDAGSLDYVGAIGPPSFFRSWEVLQLHIDYFRRC